MTEDRANSIKKQGGSTEKRDKLHAEFLKSRRESEYMARL